MLELSVNLPLAEGQARTYLPNILVNPPLPKQRCIHHSQKKRSASCRRYCRRTFQRWSAAIALMHARRMLHPRYVECQGFSYRCCNPHLARCLVVSFQYSLKKGVDFGDPDRIHLEDLNAIEKHIICPVRLYAQVIKIEGAREQSKGATQKSEGGKPSQYSLRGSVICFKHESTTVCSDLLSVENMKKDLQLQFVGPDGGWDWMYNRCYGKDPAKLVGEAYKIYSWLKILKLVNPNYKDMPDLPDVRVISTRLAQLAEELSKESIQTFDNGRVEENMMAKDDIARVRNAMSDEEDGRPAEEAEAVERSNESEEDGGDDAQQEESDNGGAANIPMRYLLVTSQDESANQNAGDSSHTTLKGAAELFGIDVSRAVRAYNREAAVDNTDNEDERIIGNKEEFNRDILGKCEVSLRGESF